MNLIKKCPNEAKSAMQDYDSSRGRSKRALQIITRCCRYQLDQLSKCLMRTHVLHLQQEPDVEPYVVV